jgi:sigma-B regulation protein RsbU (phosphoserine phosphatase)
MMMVQSAMAAIVRMRPYGSPRDIIEALNDVLYENIRKRLGQRDHVTFTLFRISPDGKVVFAGAHEDILLRRHTGRFEKIRTPGVWLGAKKGIANVTLDTTLSLDEGDLVVLYTDGITEARNDRGEQYGFDRLCTVVHGLRDQPIEQIRDRVLDDVSCWSTRRDDDATLVLLRQMN